VTTRVPLVTEWRRFVHAARKTAYVLRNGFVFQPV